MKNLVELFCDVDDFCKVFIPQWQKQLLDDGTQKHIEIVSRFFTLNDYIKS
jgi:hypothetical protein